MTPAEFKRKWSRYRGKESSAYQEHFNDLCRLLQHPTPAEADPSGCDFFCFQKRVVQGRRAFRSRITRCGRAKRARLCRRVEKGLLWLLNPPLLVVCDFDRYIVRTNFNGTVQETYAFTNEQIDRPENLRVLRSAFTDPGYQ